MTFSCRESEGIASAIFIVAPICRHKLLGGWAVFLAQFLKGVRKRL